MAQEYSLSALEIIFLTNLPDAAAAVETSKEVRAPTTNHPARGDSRGIEEIIASCKYPEEA